MLPELVELTGHPGNPATFNITKIREQNGTSTYKRIFTNGDELQIDVRHSDETKNGRTQYERHNFDVKYTHFYPDELRPSTVFQWYCVIRREKGSDPSISEGNLTSVMPQLIWLLPRIVAGES